MISPLHHSPDFGLRANKRDTHLSRANVVSSLVASESLRGWPCLGGWFGASLGRVAGAGFVELLSAEVADGDGFVAVGAWCAGAEACAEGVAVGAALNTVVAGLAVGAFVDRVVAGGFCRDDRCGLSASPGCLSAGVRAVAAPPGGLEPDLTFFTSHRNAIVTHGDVRPFLCGV